jgi:hypothetical protein
LTITGILREAAGQYTLAAPTATWNLEMPEQLLMQARALLGSEVMATGTQIGVRSYGGIFRVDGIEGV